MQKHNGYSSDVSTSQKTLSQNKVTNKPQRKCMAQMFTCSSYCGMLQEFSRVKNHSAT